MVSKIELLSFESNDPKWNFLMDLVPGERQAVSHNKHDGTSGVYLISCEEDNSETVIEFIPRIEIRIDGIKKIVEDFSKAELITELTWGKEFYLTAKPDDAKIGSILRITHE